MNVKDFLPYYIGCQCITKSYDGIKKERTISFQLFGEMALTGKFGYHIESVKPILRRLDDMKEEEAKHLLRFKPEHEILKCEKTDKYISFQYRWLDSIYDSGYGYSERALGFHQLWKPQDFHYLLKQCFDLFGLIDAGVALDAKEVKQKEA